VDGYTPNAGLTVGPSGVLYGTAVFGGTHDVGTVFKLSPVNSSWVFTPLYEFTGSDGNEPVGGVTIGPNGALYGTTFCGGSANLGVVFELRPAPIVCRSVVCYWNETVPLAGCSLRHHLFSTTILTIRQRKGDGTSPNWKKVGAANH
jgi:uncharacterized repeat protein (TIGR03803 family)